MKRLLILLLILTVFFLSVSSVSAATNTFTGTITAVTTGTARFGSGCGGSSIGAFHYILKTVSVSASGDYQMYDIGWYDGDPATIDAYVGFVQGTFNPAEPLGGCIDAADDNGFITLATGDYTLVITTFSPNVTGLYAFTLTGPGTITETSGNCLSPLPTTAVVYQIPAGAPAFFAADLGTQLPWSLPAGAWYITDFSGDFAHVWIACSGQQIWVPTNAVYIPQ